jgi:hypothetical protein
LIKRTFVYGCAWLDAVWRLDGSGKSDASVFFRTIAFLPDAVFGCGIDV